MIFKLEYVTDVFGESPILKEEARVQQRGGPCITILFGRSKVVSKFELLFLNCKQWILDI